MINFLGNVVSGEGITVDIVKVEVVVEFSAPTNVLAVQRFMGLGGYYR
jgi:hypothetical protein